MTLLKQGLIPIAVGAVAGIAGAVLSGRLLESLVEGAKSVNATAYAASVLIIAFIAALGIWTATRPIAQLEITEILRNEKPCRVGRRNLPKSCGRRPPRVETE